MNQFKAIFLREFGAYFKSPIGYVFIVIFLLTSIGCMFFLGNFYDSNQASLSVFFRFHPWLYLILVPAVGMRLWAEERRTGTEELLFTLPVTMAQAVTAKFIAGWAFIGLALLLTFPVYITVNYLGAPDNGVIFTGYIGSFLMAGAYLAITCFTSALTKNQVISFILGVVICFVLVLLGWGVFTRVLSSFLPTVLVDLIANIGFVTHFEDISRGVIDTRDLLYFFSVIFLFLTLNSITLNAKRIG